MGSAEAQWQRSVPRNAAEDASSQPFRDIVVCFTSVQVEKRQKWEKYAIDMGAITSADLTIDVTHLVVGAVDTPKYQYVAKERPDVQPMTTQWIEAARELWINDQEIDMDALEKEHKLPTLAMSKFSMTGCDDPTERLDIAEKVKANGGIYAGDLTKQITHLISFRTEGAKYKAAKSWGLKIVAIEWLWDSLERGMILNEALYDPVLPLDKRGVDAWDKTKLRRTSLGKRTRETGSSSDGGRRKLRRTASTKLTSGNENLWADISGGSIAPQVMRSGVWESAEESVPIHIKTQERDPDIGQIRSEANLDLQPAIRGIFSNCRFYLNGFTAKKSQVLHDHLHQNGGEIASTIEAFTQSTDQSTTRRLLKIIPRDIMESKESTTPQSHTTVETVTEWWVERCLHNRSFLEPSDHIIGRPFPKFPIEDFKEMTISSAAFSGIDLLHLQRAVTQIGANYSEDFTPKSSVLITKSIVGLRKDKADHALQWNVPIVNAAWLWDSIIAGEKLSITPYRLRKQKRAGSVPSNIAANHTRAERSKSFSAKGSKKPEVEFSGSSEHATARPSRLETTALKPDPAFVQKEAESHISLANAIGSCSSADASCKNEPLSEISHNTSPSRTVSTAPAPSDHPLPRPPHEDLTLNISNLLAKTKSAQPAQNESVEGRKRGAKRIFGRATSNLSTGSAPLSRASSVDSSAAFAGAAGLPTQLHESTKPASAEQHHIEHFLDEGNFGHVNTDIESQPPSTQLHYDDPASKEYKERVIARMNGESMEMRRPPMKEKAITLGDVAEQNNSGSRPRTRRTRAPPGFR